jgi:hypothetical protein
VRHWRHALAVAGLLAAGGRAGAQEATPAACAKPGDRTAVQVAVATAGAGANVGMYVYFRNAWWSGPRAARWFVHDDWDLDFRDQDKFGHMLGGYQLTRAGSELLRLGCVSERKAITWAAIYAAAFQLQIEIWDGYQQAYGFSPADLLANSAGAVLALTQYHTPALRSVKPTFSWSPTLSYRRRMSNGNTPRATVDYSGQTYWFSADVNAMLPAGAKRYWPGLVRLSVGHSVTDWVDFRNGANIRARRRLLLSLDLDPEKLPGNNRLWRTVKHELSYYHFPAPAVQFTPTGKAIAWYR